MPRRKYWKKARPVKECALPLSSDVDMGTPPIKKALSDDMGTPPLKKALSDKGFECSLDKKKHFTSDDMGTPPVKKALSDDMGTPPVEKALSDMKGTPPIKALETQMNSQMNLPMNSQLKCELNVNTDLHTKMSTKLSNELNIEICTESKSNLLYDKHETHEYPEPTSVVSVSASEKLAINLEQLKSSKNKHTKPAKKSQHPGSIKQPTKTVAKNSSDKQANGKKHLYNIMLITAKAERKAKSLRKKNFSGLR